MLLILSNRKITTVYFSTVPDGRNFLDSTRTENTHATATLFPRSHSMQMGQDLVCLVFQKLRVP